MLPCLGGWTRCAAFIFDTCFLIPSPLPKQMFSTEWDGKKANVNSWDLAASGQFSVQPSAMHCREAIHGVTESNLMFFFLVLVECRKIAVKWSRARSCLISHYNILARRFALSSLRVLSSKARQRDSNFSQIQLGSISRTKLNTRIAIKGGKEAAAWGGCVWQAQASGMAWGSGEALFLPHAASGPWSLACWLTLNENTRSPVFDHVFSLTKGLKMTWKLPEVNGWPTISLRPVSSSFMWE